MGVKNREQEMTDWTALLKNEIPTPYINRRPFVCDGFPSASKLMVIGENPGTKRNQDWWADWNAKTGYDYDTFIADYKMKKTIKGVRLRFEHLRNKIRAETAACARQVIRPFCGRWLQPDIVAARRNDR